MILNYSFQSLACIYGKMLRLLWFYSVTTPWLSPLTISHSCFFFFSSPVFFLPKYHKIIFKKVQLAMGSGTGFSSEFSGQVNFTWFTWKCSFFISFMVWRISLTPSAKLSVTIQAVQGRWFHTGDLYVQFMCEWVKWSRHKTGLCIHLIKTMSLKSSFQKSLHYRNFSRWCIPKKVKKFPVSLVVRSHLNLCKAHQRSLQLNNNIANTHFKAFLGDKKTTTSLKQSTLRICICTSSLWQCKLCLKELRISFADIIPINAWSLIIHG